MEMNLKINEPILNALFYIFGFIFVTLCVGLLVVTAIHMRELVWPFSWFRQHELFKYLQLHTFLFIIGVTSIVSVLALAAHIFWQKMNKSIYATLFCGFLVMLLIVEIILGALLVSVKA